MDSASLTGIMVVIYVATVPTVMAMMARARDLNAWLWWLTGLLPFINLFGFVLLASKRKGNGRDASS